MSKLPENAVIPMASECLREKSACSSLLNTPNAIKDLFNREIIG
ncbi:hypothetical protein LEP1GSC043_3771 [Leptospira weilii str. Ecochallenge]|uniref:Uncharacterized protein n=1 Tax=Leptospira weilii str. Ecochallenge TaxID=1049986 RepID=N1U4S7_9LEPT|nr:hypothetical protein LEP1GSC043_3771 [Leptospira weilii str. Ecochallenge]